MSYSKNRMDEVLLEILDEFQFVTGNISTRYGALRVEYGHPEPFPSDFIELANKDWFSTDLPLWIPIYTQRHQRKILKHHHRVDRVQRKR